MKQIKDFPIKSSIADADLLLVQDAADNAYKKTTKANLVAGLSTSSNYSIASGNLIADYKFTEMTGQQLIDFSGNNYHGILGFNSSVAQDDPTWIDHTNVGLDFSSNQYVSLPSAVYFSGDLTIEACMNMRVYTNWSRIVEFGIGGSPPTDNLLLGFFETSGRLVFGSTNNTTGLNLQSSISLPTYQWFYIQATLTGNAARAYVNGAEYIRGTLTAIRSITRTTNYIGRSLFSADAYFNGQIALLRLYNRALTTSERINNYLASRDFLRARGVYLP